MYYTLYMDVNRDTVFAMLCYLQCVFFLNLHTFEGAGTYECDCTEGYTQLGRSCVEQYREPATASELQWQLCDVMDGLNWTLLAARRQFVFFPGLDSPGGDYLVGTEEEAGKACRSIEHCIAYNTNGVLKHSLLPPHQWVHWTDDPRHGLYVLDIDYCQLGLEQCPAHSHCVKSAPANYSCQCVPPYLPSSEGLCQLPPVQSDEVRMWG